ncbi:MAG: hypothetical protein K2X77_19075 [Candidatus Obscuribacterales bacterium]|jgi:nucleotide-binding universal stress UspA family protein|nr:hypothetical protein [Candidatus Obscuribacterales bacterium]
MKIIIFLDGSPESLVATELASKLASEGKHTLHAETLIDHSLIRALTGFQGYAGLCGSGVFLEAHDKIERALRELKESILMSFAARTEGKGFSVECGTKEGNWKELIDSMSSPEVIHVLTEEMLSSKKVSCPTIVIANKGRLELLGTGNLTSYLLNFLDRNFPELEVGLPRLMEVA